MQRKDSDKRDSKRKDSDGQTQKVKTKRDQALSLPHSKSVLSKKVDQRPSTVSCYTLSDRAVLR